MQSLPAHPTRSDTLSNGFGAESVRVNDQILLDIMYIDGKSKLHVVDEGAHFSAVHFLPDVSTKTVLKTILHSLAIIYIGLPKRMLVDQGSVIWSKRNW